MSRLRHLPTALVVAAVPAAAATAAAPVDEAAVLATYADVAHATYEDSLSAARDLRAAIAALLAAAPSAATHQAAKDAWRAARVPYQQSEAYRFGNPIVDDWEGLVNAWPLDEGLIDYVAGAYGGASDVNPFYVADVIANPTLTSGGATIDASTIDDTGAIAFDLSGELLAVSSPRGNLFTFWAAAAGTLIDHLTVLDGCGLSAAEAPGAFVVTGGDGTVIRVEPRTGARRALTVAGGTTAPWDNHLRAAAMIDGLKS